MRFAAAMPAIFYFLFTFWIFVSAACQIDNAALYKIKMQFLQDNSFQGGFDTPKFQPTIIFGQSHNSSYALYSEGEEAGPLIRDFVKSGAVEGLLEAEDPKIYDRFQAVVSEDVEVMALVNGRHSLVSFISPMKSSSHWFVGVDSLPLCVNTFWVDQITLELEPMELVTFGESSQDYPEIIRRVSNDNTKAMYQQRTKQMSHIAKVEVTKIKEYSTLELNNLAHKELISEMKAKNDLDTLKDLEEEPFGTPRPELYQNNVIVVTRSPMHRRKMLDDSKSDLKNMDDVVLAVASGYKLGLGKHLPRHFRSRLHHAVNRHLDCEVSEWGSWSACTEPCGSGHTVRMRTIVRQREGEGRGCPHLIESKTCAHVCRGDHDYEP